MLGIPPDEITKTGAEFGYIDGIICAHQEEFRSFLAEADRAHLLVAVTADGAAHAEFTGIVLFHFPAVLGAEAPQAPAHGRN